MSKSSKNKMPVNNNVKIKTTPDEPVVGNGQSVTPDEPPVINDQSVTPDESVVGDGQSETSEVTEHSTEVTEVIVPSTVSSFDKYVEEIKEEGSGTRYDAVLSLEDYIDNMAPRLPISDQEGARYQKNLWNLFNVTSLLDSKEFTRTWQVINVYFKQYKNAVFSSNYLYRFGATLDLTPEEVDAFNNLCNLLILACDSSTRETNLKKVDLVKTTENYFSEEAKNNIINFYS